MKCLVLTDAFPNCVEPWRGPYNRQQVEALARLCQVSVVNPLSWTRVLRRPALVRAVRNGSPGLLDGVTVAHPLLVNLPLVGRPVLGHSLLRSVRKCVRNLAAEQGCDVVYSTWCFPHGYAAMRVAEARGCPFVVKLRGSDVNALPANGLRRRLAAQTLERADAIVAVSRELAQRAASLGARPGRVHVVHNGVDLARLPMWGRADARRELGLEDAGKLILFIGNLVPVKAPEALLDAVALLPDKGGVRVAFVGEGPLRRLLRRRTAELGLEENCLLVGSVPYTQVPVWLSAADVLCLPSRSEGCPNVVLEALACGTPVVASRVGAVPELLDESCGVVVAPAYAHDIARGLEAVLTAEWDREALRRRVEGMSWEMNAERLFGVLSDVCSSRPTRGRAGAHKAASACKGA